MVKRPSYLRLFLTTERDVRADGDASGETSYVEKQEPRRKRTTRERSGLRAGETEAKAVTEAKTEGAQGQADETRREGNRSEERRKNEGFGGGAGNEFGARFTTMQLDRAFTSFLF